MVFYVKNKFVSLGDGSFVVDEQGQHLFAVKGKVFSITRKKYVCDLRGNVLYTVRNKYWHFFTRKSLIYEGKSGEKVCKLKEKFFGRTLDVVDCQDDITMHSQGLFKPISVYKNGELMGEWARTLSGADFFRDSFRVSVEDEKDAAFFVALIIGVDNIRDKRTGRD
ncbi:MAG: LURP-one-related family protein [Clostridia bacterium]|nr:LURP-one-related family protein [Clostridia bacterium]